MFKDLFLKISDEVHDRQTFSNFIQTCTKANQYHKQKSLQYLTFALGNLFFFVIVL